MDGRKIRLLAAAGGDEDDGTSLYVVCEDGTIWMCYPHESVAFRQWEQLPSIPAPRPDAGDGTGEPTS